MDKLVGYRWVEGSGEWRKRYTPSGVKSAKRISCTTWGTEPTFYSKGQWTLTLEIMSLDHTYTCQFSSVQSLSRVRLCDPMDCSTQASVSITNSQSLLKLLAIESVMPSHLLPSPSPPAFYLSQHQGLFHWVSSSHQVAKVLEFKLQHQSF